MDWLIVALLVGGMVPYGFTVISKAGAFGKRDNARTRDWQTKLEGWRQRAHWSQLNSFEGYPLYAAAILASLVRGSTDPWLPFLAWGYIACRVLYGAFYIGDKPRLRSLTWTLGLLCPVVILVRLASGGPF